jgi:hypothetical protein
MNRARVLIVAEKPSIARAFVHILQPGAQPVSVCVCECECACVCEARLFSSLQRADKRCPGQCRVSLKLQAVGTHPTDGDCHFCSRSPSVMGGGRSISKMVRLSLVSITQPCARGEGKIPAPCLAHVSSRLLGPRHSCPARAIFECPLIRYAKGDDNVAIQVRSFFFGTTVRGRAGAT